MRTAALKLPPTSYEELHCDESREGDDIVLRFSRTKRSDPFQVVQLLRDIGAPRLLVCPVCRNAFIPGRQDQRYCGPRCAKANHDQRQKSSHKLIAHNARAEKRAKHDIHFCAIDGEGVSRYDADGNVVNHTYALLGATGCSPLHKDGRRLTTADIFHYLYYVVFTETEKRHPGSSYDGFALGYDWAQWFRDLPEHQARLLLTKEGIASRQRRHEHAQPYPVYWRVSEELEWEFDILGDKRFRLRPYTGPRRQTYRSTEFPDYKPAQWMYICDTFGYFQTSFLAVIDPTNRLNISLEPYVTEAEYREIERGKNRRADAQFDLAMIGYNDLECKALSAVMTDLNRGLVKNNLRLKKNQYFGPGQGAQRWLSQLAEDVTSETYQKHSPPRFRKAARDSYYGGMFETFYHGTYRGTVHSYDINSAYPAVMARLPCLLHGEYLEGIGDPHDDPRLTAKQFGAEPGKVVCFVEARVSGRNPRIGAMQHRTRNNRILRPNITEGWHCQHEIEVSRRAGLISEVQYYRWHAYIPCDCPPPLRSLADLYNDRIELGETGKNSPEGVSKKLIYNSAYGKFAQSVGNPKFGNAVYASLITAGCRCMILDFIATHPEGANTVLEIATDGIYTALPHPDIELSKTKLGAWDHKELSNLTLYKPGCRWDDSARDKIRSGDFDKIQMKSRGVPVKAVVKRILEIDEQFAEMKPGDPWPHLTVPIPFSVISPRLALARGNWKLCGKVESNKPVKITSDPKAKRQAYGPGWSEPYRVPPGSIRSTPYDKRFGDEAEGDADPAEQGTVYEHPDGEIGDQLVRAIMDLGT